MKQIVIPIDGQNSTIDSIQNFVIVGANGSGKSHLGAWIETNNKDVLRISAQRALSVPDVITLKVKKMLGIKFYMAQKQNMIKAINGIGDKDIQLNS